MADDWDSEVNKWAKDDAEFKDNIRGGLDPFGRVKVEPPSRRGIVEGVQRGAKTAWDTFIEELTSPLTEIPGGIKQSSDALTEAIAAEREENRPKTLSDLVVGRKEQTALDKLRNLGTVLWGGGRAGLSVGRAVFSPATALAKGAYETGVSSVEYPGQEDQRSRPWVFGVKPTDALEFVAEFAGSIPVGLKGEKLFKQARAYIAAKTKVPVEKIPEPVVSDFAKKIDEWRAAEAATTKEEEKFRGPINRWAKQRQAEQEAEAAKVALIKSNAEAEAATEQERLFRLKERFSQDPIPPGPRNQYPRVEDAPPGESSPWPPRQLTEGTQPKRVIEAPPKSPGSLEDAVLRSVIREQQGLEGVGPRGPHARVVIDEPGYRDPVTGDWVSPKPKMVDVPEPTPSPLPSKNVIDRIRGREEVVVGRGQGWIRQGDDLVLIDDLDNINAKIVPKRIGSGADRRVIFELQDGDGKLIKQFSEIEEAAAAASKRFPNKIRKPPPEPPTTPEPPAPAAPVTPTPPTPSAPTTVPPTAAEIAELEAQAAGLRKTFGPAEPVVPKVEPPFNITPPRPTDVAVDPIMPHQIIDKVNKTRWDRAYDAITEAWRPFAMKAKAAINVNSPSNILKDYPIVQRLIHITDETRHAINNKADTFAAAYRDLTKAIGSPDETSRLLKLRDARAPMPGVSATIQQKIDDFYRLVEDMTGNLPGESIFKDGFHKRLIQSHVIQDGKIVPKEHVTEDVSRILGSGKKMKGMLSKVLTGDEAYTPDNVVRTLRAIARQSEMGTKLSPGYLAKIKPILADIEKMPEIVRGEATDLVNHFIGVPGSRSPQWLQRWADRSRAYQFASKIGGNITSPIWNSGQNFLTIAETDLRSFGKATKRMWDDMIVRKTGGVRDPEYVKLLKDAGMEHELAAPGVLSDIGIVPSDLASGFDNVLNKTVDISGKGFRWVEKNNRLRAFLSGYEDGVARNMSREAAIENGKSVMRKTQFTSGEADIPGLFRGAKGGAVGQFKTFVVKYHEYMVENTSDFIKAFANPHLTPTERLHNVNKFAKFWGSQMLVAGPAVVPGAEYVLGDKLKDQPEWVQHGVGGALGISLAKQFGVGPLPVDSYKNFLYNLPGPTLGAMQDVLSLSTGWNWGSGGDMSKWGHELSWDEWERKAVRLLPLGVQAARVIEYAKNLQSGGERHKSLTPAQAFGLEPATGPKLSEVVTDALGDLMGTRDLRREKEVDINEKARADVEIERRARINASELYTGGKQEEAQAVLKKASEKLGRRVIMDYGNIRAAQEAEYKTALERLREKQGKRGVVIPRP